MSFANLLNLTNVEMGLIMVGTSIFLSLMITLFYFKRSFNRLRVIENSSVDSIRIRELTQESEKICQELSKNLEEKKEIIKQLMTHLDQRVQTLQALLKMTEEEKLFRPKEKDLNGRICEMAEGGLDVSDIAKRLGLSQGEVQLTLDLKRYHSSDSVPRKNFEETESSRR